MKLCNSSVLLAVIAAAALSLDGCDANTIRTPENTNTERDLGKKKNRKNRKKNNMPDPWYDVPESTKHKDVIDALLMSWYPEEPEPVPPIEKPKPTPPVMPVPPIEPTPPGLVCVDRSLEIDNGGDRGTQCIRRNEAICRGDWMFGIVDANIPDTYQVTAWEWVGGGYADIAYAEFDTAEELCVGKTKRDDGNTAFMSIKTENGVWYLVCPDVGRLNKDPKLKIRVRKDKEKKRNKSKRSRDFYNTIVKYRRGAADDDTLWAVMTDGTDKTNDGCYWKLIDNGKPSVSKPPSMANVTAENPIARGDLPPGAVPDPLNFGTPENPIESTPEQSIESIVLPTEESGAALVPEPPIVPGDLPPGAVPDPLNFDTPENPIEPTQEQSIESIVLPTEESGAAPVPEPPIVPGDLPPGAVPDPLNFDTPENPIEPTQEQSIESIVLPTKESEAAPVPEPPIVPGDLPPGAVPVSEPENLGGSV